MTRVILVGGKRHGEWCDMPEPLPSSYMIPWPPQPVVWTFNDDDVFMDDIVSKSDRYYRVRGTLTTAGKVEYTTVYMASEAVGPMDWLWVNSAIHIGHCSGYCGVYELHDTPSRMSNNFIIQATGHMAWMKWLARNDQAK
jgi:hypothetical protein